MLIGIYFPWILNNTNLLYSLWKKQRIYWFQQQCVTYLIIHASRQPRRCFQVVDNIPGYFRQPRPLLVSLGTDPRLGHRLFTDKEKFDSHSAKVYSRKTTFNLVLVVALVLLGLLWLRTSMSMVEGGGLSTWYWLLVRWYCCCRVSTPSPAVGCSATASSTLLWFIKCNTGKLDQIDPTKGQLISKYDQIYENRQIYDKHKIQGRDVSPWSAILLHVMLHFAGLFLSLPRSYLRWG